MIDISTLKKKILSLAFQGKLTEQLPSDLSVDQIIDKCKEDKQRSIAEGKYKSEEFRGAISTTSLERETPHNWRYMFISDMALFQEGPGILAVNFRSEGVPLIRIAGMNGKVVTLKGCNYLDPKMVEEKWKHFKLDVGDVVISSSASLDRIAEVDDEAAGAIPYTGLIRFKMYGGIDKEYFKWFLKSPYYIEQVNSQKKGGFIQHYGPSHLKKMVIPIPPLEEQGRISEKLNEIFRYIEIIEKLQSEYCSNLEELKSKLIDAGIHGKLTEQLPEDGDAEDLYNQIQAEKTELIKEGKLKKEKPLPEITKGEIPFNIPKNWKWVRLGDISAKISSGNTPAGGKNSDAYVENGYCFFREQNIYDDGIHEEGLVYITEELLKTRVNSTVLPMDILLNITGGSIGRCALVPDNFTKGSINQHILIIRMIDSRLRFYVHKCICSPYIQKYIKGNVVGDKDGFSGGRCKNMLIPLPPIEEQERIVEILEKFLLQF